jgi:hypothetical protein
LKPRQLLRRTAFYVELHTLAVRHTVL